MQTISAADFVTEVRRLGGFETLDQANSFVTDDEIVSRGNANLRKVYFALVRAREANYYRTAATFSTVIGQSTYDLTTIAPDIFELLSMDRQYGSRWIPMLDFNESERDDYVDWPLAVFGSPVRFQLRVSTLELTPTPAAIETFRLYYVPDYVPMSFASEEGGSSVDANVYGYHEWAIWETVAELQAKDMVDPTTALMRSKWWENEVESMARQRYAGGPRRISRVRDQRRRGRW